MYRASVGKCFESIYRADRRNRRPSGKKSCARVHRFSRTGILFPNFPGTKENGRASPDFQFKVFKSVPRCATFQNGNTSVCARGITPRPLVGVNRPAGCVPTCSYPSKVSSTSTFCVQREGVSIQCASLRPGDCTARVYNPNEAGACILPPSRVPTKCFSRRLDSASCRRFCAPKSVAVSPNHLVLFGVGSERNQIPVSTNAAVCVPRHGFRPTSGPCPPDSTANRSNRKTHWAPVNQSTIHSARAISRNRHPGLHGLSSSVWRVASATPTLVPEVPLVSGDGIVRRRPTSNVRLPTQCATVVDGRQQFASGGTASRTSPTRHSLHGCVVGGVGRPLKCTPCGRELDTESTTVAHKRTGVDCGAAGAKRVPAILPQPSNSGTDGQYDSCVVFAKGGGDPLGLITSCGVRDIRPLHREWHTPPFVTHTGSPERDGRRFIQGKTSSNDGVVPAAELLRRVISFVGRTLRGSVRITSEPSRLSICVGPTRPARVGLGRADDGLERPLCLPVSPVRAIAQSASENSVVTGQVSSDSPELASAALVPRAVVAPDRPPTSAPASPVPVDSVRGSQGSPRHPRASTSRLDVITRRAIADGFPEEVAARVAQPVRASTAAIYNSKWSRWVRWCDGREANPLAPSVALLCEFFVYLFDESLSVSAIKGYRSALNTVFRSEGCTALLDDYRVRDLLRSFSIERPYVRKPFPAWDLPLVLRCLRLTPYEPLGEADLANLTKKTAFLLALASGSRRSEICAWTTMRGHLVFTAGYAAVRLLPHPRFRAKTQRPNEASVPVVIPALTPVAGDTADKLLCPIRALRWYLDRTAGDGSRPAMSPLFLPFKAETVKVTPAMMSRWLCDVIFRAYDSEGDPVDTSNARITAHEIRALSASWATTNHIPIDDVLQAASWRHQTTFTSHYLRDLCHQADDLYTLGPIVASQRVVVPPN